MLPRIVSVFVASLLMLPLVQAQSPGKIELEAASVLIGAPVIAADGDEIGQVFNLVLDDDGQPRTLLLSTGALIGFGARTVEVPRGAFRIDGRRVILRLTADEVARMPGRLEQSNERQGH